MYKCRRRISPMSEKSQVTKRKEREKESRDKGSQNKHKHTHVPVLTAQVCSALKKIGNKKIESLSSGEIDCLACLSLHFRKGSTFLLG